jgi:hypothetical protein
VASRGVLSRSEREAQQYFHENSSPLDNSTEFSILHADDLYILRQIATRYKYIKTSYGM